MEVKDMARNYHLVFKDGETVKRYGLLVKFGTNSKMLCFYSEIERIVIDWEYRMQGFETTLF